MSVIITGLSHKTAPVEIRERLSISKSNIKEALDKLKRYSQLSESLILSTCNRVEIYGVVYNIEEGKKCIEEFLSTYHQIERKEFQDYLYTYTEEQAIRHLFRVSCSLDSLVVGETHIFAQVKQAFKLAQENKNIGPLFIQLFREAFRVAKIVRIQTEIGKNAVSISSVALDLVKDTFGSLEGKKVLIIGAGKMGELTARYFISAGAETVFVANRTYEKAVAVAKQFNGRAIRFMDMFKHMVEVDIVISSTGAPHQIVSKTDVQEIILARQGKPIFFIDIAVPRDIDPEAGRIKGVFLSDIDDLQTVADRNLKERLREAQKAQIIVDQELQGMLVGNSLFEEEMAPTYSACTVGDD